MTSPVAGAADLSRPRSVLDLVGNTPLLRLRRFERADGRVQLYAKAEWKNPGGSVKDRAAAAMILDGERRGLLDSRTTILDATSGNTGIAYAMIGAARGYRREAVHAGATSRPSASASCARTAPSWC